MNTKDPNNNNQMKAISDSSILSPRSPRLQDLAIIGSDNKFARVSLAYESLVLQVA